jgi:uncharacterized repeat protein (TIGR03803 family)
LHEFGAEPADGTNPSAELIDVNGTFYGTTVAGGNSCCAGTVFSISKRGQEKVLYRFASADNSDGYEPAARLIDVDRTLYGTTLGGGTTNSSGTVFSITLDGKEKVLHSFNFIGHGGSSPLAGLINVNGTLYGTTSGTYPYDNGTVFSITTHGKFKVIHIFGQGYDGASPQSALLDVNGTLYGTTTAGGQYGHGTVFSVTTAGQERVLHSFGASDNDGTNPSSDLIDVQGKFYGTTTTGGSSGNGTVFSITTDGTEKVVHSFSGKDGSQPVAGLIDVKGVLYGTTTMGGAKNRGTVFSVTRSGDEKVVHSFRAGGGENPRAALLDVDGVLYGTAYGVPSQRHGNVFSITP